MGHNENCSGLRNRFRCIICGKGYMMDWARDNHEKLHKERIKSKEK